MSRDVPQTFLVVSWTIEGLLFTIDGLKMCLFS